MQVPGVVTFLLMHVKEFQSGTVWVDVSQMDGITMSISYGIEHLTVIVEGGRAPHDFILAVTVDIANGEVVVSVGIHRIASQS